MGVCRSVELPIFKDDEEGEEEGMEVAEIADAPESQAVVLHEDKKYYPTAEEVYGPEVEVGVN